MREVLLYLVDACRTHLIRIPPAEAALRRLQDIALVGPR